MAYLVSQLRKNQNTAYMTPISIQPSTIISPNPFGGQNTFTDFAFKGDFEYQKVYYLRFKIHQIPQYFYSGSKTPGQVSMYGTDADTLNLQILLKNNNENDQENIPPETIGTCNVPIAIKQNEEDETDKQRYSSYSFVFSPSKNFDRLGIRIQRVSFDAINNPPRNWLIDEETVVESNRYTGQGYQSKKVKTTGPRIKYEGADGDFCLLNNLVNKDAGWLKFGYQCRPGSLIVVNKEPIRLGRSGIYEINNGTIIKEFMIASPGGSDNSKIDAFLLDYAYKD